jgi:hypothetical protein
MSLLGNELPPEFEGLQHARLRKDYEPFVLIMLRDEKLMSYCLNQIKHKGKTAFLCARLLQLASDINIDLFKVYAADCIEILCNKPPEPSVKRTLLRIFIKLEIPNSHLVKAYDTLLSILRSHHESIACRAFSIQVLAGICRREPELIHEALLVVQEEFQFGSSGFKNSARHFIQEFSPNKSKRKA